MRLIDVLTLGMAAIITVVLLVPVLAGISQNQQNTICRDHLRSLAGAVNRYAKEHDGALPAAVDREPNTWTWWFDHIRTEVDRNRWFYCPANTPDEFEEGEVDPLRPEIWNIEKLAYGMNWRFDPRYHDDGEPVQRAAIDDPARLVILGDSEFYLMRATESLWSKDASTRHGGKANFAFLDGHVKLVDPQPDEYVKTDAEGILQRKHWYPEQ